MTDDMFAEEIVFSARRRARWALVFGGLGLLIAALSLGALMLALPLKETKVHVLLVDAETGLTERLAAVQQAPLETERAIAEASLVAYVTDRETFDATGAEERVNHVLALSAEQAAADWTRLWSSESPDYPLKHYDLKDRIHVKVRAVTFLDNETAQIRFIKRLITQHGQERSAAFVATVAFAFEPRQERKLEDVWENPLGFQVTRYRVDAETLEGGRL